jgi:hypothetical protein
VFAGFFELPFQRYRSWAPLWDAVSTRLGRQRRAGPGTGTPVSGA